MSTHPELEQIHHRLTDLRNELLEHPVYQVLDTPERMRQFMQLHVFAVWDFMSLLKALQRELTCVTVPWVPSAQSEAARFINDIVIEEETDQLQNGGYASHFEMYLSAMEECGADVAEVGGLIAAVREGKSVAEALQTADVPEPARQFVQKTFDIIASGDVCAIASAFTFGREGLLPELFPQIVTRLHHENYPQFSQFKYYLDRHILLDGGEHGPMADRMLVHLCGNEPERWRIVEETAVQALTVRKRLWDGILEAIDASAEMCERT